MRRLASLVLAIACSFVPVSTVSAAYYGDCDSAGSYNGGDVFARAARDRIDIQNNLFKGAYGRSTIKDIRSCTSPNGPSTVGKTLVLPANITASNSWLVQLGYARQDCPTGYSCDLPDNQRVFVYTPSDTSFGVIEPFPNAETPELGNVYSFKIESGPTGFWYYTIKDLTDNQTWSTTRTQTFASGASTLYGFEVGRYWDQIGFTSTDRAKADFLQYRRSDVSAWQILTDDPFTDCVPASSVCYVDESLFGFHNVYVSNESGPYDPDQTYVKAYTDSH